MLRRRLSLHHLGRILAQYKSLLSQKSGNPDYKVADLQDKNSFCGYMHGYHAMTLCKREARQVSFPSCVALSYISVHEVLTV